MEKRESPEKKEKIVRKRNALENQKPNKENHAS